MLISLFSRIRANFFGSGAVKGTAGEITQFPGKLRKREDRRVKKLVRQVVLLLCPAIQGGISVLMVPQNRMADGGEMGADLMGPARHQQDFEKGQFPVAVHRRVFRLDRQENLCQSALFPR